MTYKNREIETNKKIIVHYDRTKPFPLPPGGFVPPPNTPLAPMQPPNELFSNSFPAKCHCCFFEAPITCAPTVGPIPVSSSVQIVQPALPTTFALTPVVDENPPEPSAPLEEELIPNRSSDSTLPYSSHVPEVVNSQTVPSTLLFPPHPFLMTHFRSSTPPFLLLGRFSP